MTDADVAFLTVVFGATLTLITIEHFRRKRPCWLFGHPRNHLSIEKRVWNNGTCPRPDHPNHGQMNLCYITKWVCTKPGCGHMDYYCVGEASKGAWTIQHGKVVPDEKEWSRW